LPFAPLFKCAKVRQFMMNTGFGSR